MCVKRHFTVFSYTTGKVGWHPLYIIIIPGPFFICLKLNSFTLLSLFPVTGTKVFVMPGGMMKSNGNLVDLIEKVKPEIRTLIEKCNTVSNDFNGVYLSNVLFFLTQHESQVMNCGVTAGHAHKQV